MSVGHVIAAEAGKVGSDDVIVGKQQRLGSVAVDESDDVVTTGSHHAARQRQVGRLRQLDQFAVPERCRHHVRFCIFTPYRTGLIII